MNLPRSSLDNHFFPEKIDQSIFQELLATLDEHINIEFISREEFQAKKGKYLENTGESDKYGDYYILSLPEDLQVGETLEIIDRLSQEFEITDYTPLDTLFTQTKLAIISILREHGEEKGGEIIKSFIDKYNVSGELQEKIRNQGMLSFGDTKNLIRDICSQREKEKKSRGGLGKSGDSEIIQNILSDTLEQEFDLTFFRKGVNMIRHGMMTITQIEQEEIRRKIGKKQKGENIIIHVGTHCLDINERLLRDKINIKRLKNILIKVRKEGNIQKIVEHEHNAAQKIAKFIHEFPYQSLKNKNGYQPSQIIHSKEIQCVGYSVLAHAFLSELGIKHKCLSLEKHSAIHVIIGGEDYLMDGASRGRLYKTTLESDIETAQDISILGLGYSDQIEQGLYSHIVNNHIIHPSMRGLGIKRISIMEDKVIKFNPRNWNSYLGKGIIAFIDMKVSAGILYWFTKKALKGRRPILGVFMRRSKKKIRNYIKEGNYKGLTSFLKNFEK